MRNKTENIDEVLLLRIIENKANDSEVTVFNQWYNLSAENAAMFAQLKRAYELSSFDKHSIQENWKQISDKVRTGYNVPDFIEIPDPEPTGKAISLQPLLRVAATVAIIVGIFFLFKIVAFNSEQIVVSGNSLENNEPYQLADGSLVYLNGDAEISFSTHFGEKNRELKLVGEAFFEVKRNEKLPFQITSNNTITKVLGTAFNVFSDMSGNVKVSVVSGVVAFYTNKRSAVELRSGQQGSYNSLRESIEKDRVNNLNFLAWRTGVLTFENTPLVEVFELLNRQYSKTFLYKGESSKMPNITTTFDNQSLEAVLEELNLLLNTKNVLENDTIIFKPAS